MSDWSCVSAVSVLVVVCVSISEMNVKDTQVSIHLDAMDDCAAPLLVEAISGE